MDVTFRGNRRLLPRYPQSALPLCFPHSFGPPAPPWFMHLFGFQPVFQCCFWLTALGQYQRKPKRIRAFCSSGELGELQKHLIQQDQYLQDLPYTAQLTSGCRYSVKCSSEASSCSGFYLHHINICLGPQQEILSEEELWPSPVAHLHLPMWYKAGRILDPSRRR